MEWVGRGGLIVLTLRRLQDELRVLSGGRFLGFHSGESLLDLEWGGDRALDG